PEFFHRRLRLEARRGSAARERGGAGGALGGCVAARGNGLAAQHISPDGNHHDGNGNGLSSDIDAARPLLVGLKECKKTLGSERVRKDFLISALRFCFILEKSYYDVHSCLLWNQKTVTFVFSCWSVNRECEPFASARTDWVMLWNLDSCGSPIFLMNIC
ncbi:unnamed protein product, partial [Urochloa humidicola]